MEEALIKYAYENRFCMVGSTAFGNPFGYPAERSRISENILVSWGSVGIGYLFYIGSSLFNGSMKKRRTR